MKAEKGKRGNGNKSLEILKSVKAYFLPQKESRGKEVTVISRKK